MTDGAPLMLFDSLTRQLKPFDPIEKEKARVYSCGPTVYARQHLGNMRAYIFTDTLTRVLEWKGYDVNHVVNITDVGHLTSDADAGDDKMEKAAAAEQLSARAIADRYTDLFKADLAKLNVREPSRWSLATDHIDDMIAFAARLGGSTYEAPSGLYFDTTSVPDYGRLAGHRPEAPGAPEVGRIEGVAGKRHPADFAIWRRSEEPGRRQMEWPSPWGIGAPGWHLECSVMSMKYLGTKFDIHTGGIDHREIHHPNEIAQNQAFTGTAETGANIWMHNNFLVERGAKMSKSSGGFATLDTLIEAGVHPLAYRLLCLSAHYRSELEFSAENVLAALTRLKRLAMAVGQLDVGLRRAARSQRDFRYELLRSAKRTYHNARSLRGASMALARADFERELSPRGTAALSSFDDAVSSDLATPKGLAVLDDIVADKQIDAIERLRLVATIDLVFGFDLLGLTRTELRRRPAAATFTIEEVSARLAERKAARAAKDFATGDAIRDDLVAAGVEIMDGDPLGWDWRPRLD